ncbi:hypothetical protein IJI02_00500 [Candidatus Saccharibacteria bacterium]|nr:hypothetical protein [Candidatus Saccharibacteria bacterium]
MNKRFIIISIIAISASILLALLLAFLLPSSQPDSHAAMLAADAESEAEMSAFYAKYPLTKSLPLRTDNYRITFYTEDNQPVLSLLPTSSAHINSAVSALLDLSDDLYDYKITVQKLPLLTYLNNSTSANLDSYLNVVFSNQSNFRIVKTASIPDTNYTAVLVSINSVNYRFALKPKDSSYNFLTAPYPLLSSYDSEHLSREAIKFINSL